MQPEFCLSHHPPSKNNKRRNKRRYYYYNENRTLNITHTANTYPDNDSSPVMAIIGFKGTFQKREINAEAIVIPADGPSFLCPPSGR